MCAAWTPAIDLAELDPGRPRALRLEGRRVLLLRAEDGRLFAADDACPHEGYPLSQGLLQGCVLTCAWHNFKFDLRDGRCVKGDEDLAVYPVRVVGGKVELDLGQPDPAAAARRARTSLTQALAQQRVGQACRDLARLLAVGVAPERLLGELAALDGRLAEWGSTHALAVAADVTGLLPGAPGGEATLLLAQVAELIAEAHPRRPARPRPEPEAPPADPERAFLALRERVEAEDAGGAEALLLGAIEGGWGREVLEPWFVRLCADHFVGFGHPLIYTPKAFDLLDRAGWDLAPDVLGGLMQALVHGTREDLLPAWRPWRARVEELAPQLPALFDRQVRGGPAWWDRQGLVEALLDARPPEALGALVRRVEEGVPAPELLGALAVAAATRVLRFNPALAADPGVQEGWLDVTHTLTFTRAVREAWVRAPGPHGLLLILQAGRFVHGARALDLPPAERVAPEAGAPADAALAVQAARRGELALALGAGRAALAAGQGPALRQALITNALTDGAVRPIFSAHLLKTTLAGFAEWEEQDGEPGAERLALAPLRLAAGPLHERSLARLVVEARGLVERGAVPRRLT